MEKKQATLGHFVLVAVIGVAFGTFATTAYQNVAETRKVEAQATTQPPPEIPIHHFGDIWVVGDVKYEIAISSNKINPSPAYLLYAYQGKQDLGPLASCEKREPLAIIAQAMSEVVSRSEFFEAGYGSDRYSSTTHRLFAGPKQGQANIDWWCLTYNAGDNLAEAVEGYWSRKGK